MTRGSSSGAGRDGLLARLFGRWKASDHADAVAPAEHVAAEPPSAELSSAEPVTAGTAADEFATAGPANEKAGYDVAPQPDLDDRDEEDDELVLGPPQMVGVEDQDAEARQPGSAEAPNENARGADEALPEEEALVARLREAGVSGALPDSTTRQEFEMPPEAEASDTARPDQAAPAPEEEGPPGIAWRSGGKRDDGEGELSAGNPGREGRKPMEAQEMNRDDEKDHDEEQQGSEDETAAEPVALFPGARAAEESTESDESDEAAESGPEEVRGDRSEDEADPEELQPVTAGTDDAEAGDTGTDTPDPEPQEPEELTLGAPAAADDSARAGAFSEGGSGAGEAPAGSGGDFAGVEEVVRRLIREELEGELGERLSKNIRRMIREEVSHQLLRQR